MSQANQQFDLTGNKQKSNPASFEPLVRGVTDPPQAHTRETKHCKQHTTQRVMFWVLKGRQAGQTRVEEMCNLS